MIVTCQRCETSFQLDDSRVPESGIRVRCSRCKEAFFLPHPSAGAEGAVHGIAGEAAEHGGAPPPGSTQDLTGEAPPASAREESSVGGSELEEEEDWEFNEEFPADEGEFEDESDLIGDPLDAADDEGVEEDSVPLIAGDGMPPGLQEEVQQEVAEDESAFGTMDDYSSLMEDEDAPPRDVGSPAASAPAAEAPPARASAPAAEELGDPEDWDFFSDEGLDLADGEGAQASSAAPSASAPPLAESKSAKGDTAPSLSTLPATSAGARVSVVEHLRSVGSALGWILTLALLTVGLGQGLRSSYAAVSTGPRFVEVGGMVAEAVEGSWVDTAQLGQVLTVTGRLRNPGNRAALLDGVLQVILLDAEGQPLDHPPILAGLALDPDGLRSLAPEVLAAARIQAARALHSTRIPPGAPLEFMVAIDELPARAARFDLALASPDELLLPWESVPVPTATLESAVDSEEIVEPSIEDGDSPPPGMAIEEESPATLEVAPSPGA